MLVDKRIIELTNFTAKKGGIRSVLEKLLITDTEIVATNGHVLAVMPVDKGLYDDNFPTGAPLDTEISTPVLLPVEQIGNAVALLPQKPTLPCSHLLQIGTVNSIPVINAGLPVVQVPGEKVEGSEPYPNYKHAIPGYDNTNSVKLHLDGALLKRLCVLASRYDKSQRRVMLEIPIASPHVFGAVKWKVAEDKETVFHGVIMSLRVSE